MQIIVGVRRLCFVVVVVVVAVASSACAPRPIARSAIVRHPDLPSLDGFRMPAEVCAANCPGVRAGERLLWCHDANFSPSNRYVDAAHDDNEMVLVCNYGAD